MVKQSTVEGRIFRTSINSIIFLLFISCQHTNDSISLATGMSENKDFGRKYITINNDGSILYYNEDIKGKLHYYKGNISTTDAIAYIKYVNKNLHAVSLTDSSYSYIIRDGTKLELNIKNKESSRNYFGYLENLSENDTIVKILRLPNTLKLKQTDVFGLSTKVQNEVPPPAPPAPLPNQLP